MPYKISPGISETKLAGWLKQAAQKYGTFEDGRVNYSSADIAPVVMCTLICQDELLLVKRGQGLADANGYWSTVNGFIDEIKPVTMQVKQEISEELGTVVSEDQIKVGRSYTVAQPKEKRKYIVFPCLVTFSHKPEVVLDYENTDFVWIKRPDLEKYNILDDLPYVIDSALTA